MTRHALLCFVVLASCGNDDAARPDESLRGSVALPVDAAVELDASATCPRDAFALSEGDCRAQWTCAGTNARTLICLASDAGELTCACIVSVEAEEEEDAGPTLTGTAQQCETAADAADIARRICSWSVE